MPPVPLLRGRNPGMRVSRSGFWAKQDHVHGPWRGGIEFYEHSPAPEIRVAVENSRILDRRFKTLQALQKALYDAMGRENPEFVLKQCRYRRGHAVSCDRLFAFEWRDENSNPSYGQHGWTIEQHHYWPTDGTDPLTILLRNAGLEAQQTCFPTLLEARKALALVWHPRLREELGL